MEKRTVLLIVAFSLVKFFTINVNKGYWWDETVYLSLAKNIITGKGYQVTGFEQFRPPLFPAILAIALLISKSALLPKITVAITSVLALSTTALAAKRIYDKKTAFYSALFLATNILFAFFSYKILTEPLFIALATMALLSFYEKKLKMAGLFTGLCCLLRHFGLLLLPIFATYLLIEKKARKIKTREAALGALVFAATLLPWTVLNYYNYKNPIGAQLQNFAVHSSAQGANTDLAFYLKNWWEIFGIATPFMLFGIFLAVKKPDSKNKFLLVYSLIALLAFSFLFNIKRFMLSFISGFLILSAKTASDLARGLKKQAEGLLIIFLIAMPLPSLYTKIKNDSLAGSTIIRAADYINQNMENKPIITVMYSYMTFFTENDIIRPPINMTSFLSLMKEKNAVFVNYETEPGNPEFVKNIDKNESFRKITSFERDWEKTSLWESNT